MNAYRMFAFATALLLTAFLFRVIADRYLYEPRQLAMATDGRHGRAE
jgi:hypothetical protein